MGLPEEVVYEWDKAKLREASTLEDVHQGRNWDFPHCGERHYSQVKQAERDEGCLYVCQDCGQIVDELTPF